MAAARKIPKKTGRARNGPKKDHKQRAMKAHPAPPSSAQSIVLPAEPPGFLVVGIGASAGGLEALEEFFRHASR